MEVVLVLCRLLLELLELLFDKFNAVAAAHSIVLGHLQQTVASPCSQYDGDIKLYDMVDVWVKIQDVLQVRVLQMGTVSACSSSLNQNTTENSSIMLKGQPHWKLSFGKWTHF